MELKFVKMHGVGNDYIFIDLINNNYSCEWSNIAVKLSNRNFGIGSDGIVLISKSEIADAKMSMYNSDGSVGKMCGNAIRCVTKYLIDNSITYKNKITIETLSGIKNCHAYIENSKCIGVTVDMGIVSFDTKSIVVDSFYKDNQEFINKLLTVGNDTFRCTLVTVGNPHCVIFVEDKLVDIEQGRLIEQSKIFIDRTNVEFVRVIDSSTLVVRVFERGSGETLACGTGACASVAVAIKLGYCNNDSNIKVNLKGGELLVRQNSSGTLLNGPCESVFSGVVYI